MNDLAMRREIVLDLAIILGYAAAIWLIGR
jgi:hypothetical protein